MKINYFVTKISVTEKIIPLAGVNVLMLGLKDQPQQLPLTQQFKGKSLVRALEPYENISKMVRKIINITFHECLVFSIY